MGHSLWGCKELDTTERLTLLLFQVRTVWREKWKCAQCGVKSLKCTVAVHLSGSLAVVGLCAESSASCTA